MNNKVWNLDTHVDISGLERLHLDICHGIALSTRDLSTRVIPHYEAKGNIAAAIDYKNKEIPRIAAVKDDALDVLNENEQEVYKTLNYNQKRVFLELYKGAYTDGEFVRIRFTKQENLNEKLATFYSDTTEFTENAKYFSKLIEWTKTLPFIDIGRILIIITKHHLHGDIHYDRRDDWLDGRHHFLWLNPFNQKKFSIYEGYKEIPITSKVIFFDTSNIHGAGVNDTTTYTVRIDGQLSKDFCDKTGIPWKQR